MLVGAGSTLLLLWFKGTAAFYLRRVDVDDQGSAFRSAPEARVQRFLEVRGNTIKFTSTGTAC
jgi:hypothetical protein